MLDRLGIISFNFDSLKMNIDVIRKVVNNCYVLCLQETFICDIDDSYLDRIDKSCTLAFSPAIGGNALSHSRLKGGLIIFWKKFRSINTFINLSF